MVWLAPSQATRQIAEQTDRWSERMGIDWPENITWLLWRRPPSLDWTWSWRFWQLLGKEGKGAHFSCQLKRHIIDIRVGTVACPSWWAQQDIILFIIVGHVINYYLIYYGHFASVMMWKNKKITNLFASLENNNHFPFLCRQLKSRKAEYPDDAKFNVQDFVKEHTQRTTCPSCNLWTVGVYDNL